MCGRYVISSSAEIIAELFDAPFRGGMEPRYNIAPTQLVPVVQGGEQGRSISLMRWGLTPAWAEPKLGPRGGVRLPDFINARSETAAVKPSFRRAWKTGRCLLPADGFYEWKKEPGGGKQAYHIRMHRPHLFAMAALWERWVSPEGESRDGVCVLTTRASADLRGLHDRMPVILHPDHFSQWLDPFAPQPGLEALMRPLPDGLLHVYPVSNRVNRPREDDPGLLIEA